MSAVASASGGHWAYRGPNGLNGGQRATALAAVVALHALVIGGLIIAQLNAPKPPPEPTITVSLISEAPATQAPTPPAPPEPTPPPPPERQMLATPRPTPSPMTAPPVEEVRREAPQPPAPQAPPQPAAPSSPAPAAATAAAVSPPSFTAAYLNNPAPTYPVSARRRKTEGVVRLRVQVSAEGAPLQVLLDRTSGSADLDAAALDVVKKRWKFAPAKQGDRAVAAWVIVPLEFSLN